MSDRSIIVPQACLAVNSGQYQILEQILSKHELEELAKCDSNGDSVLHYLFRKFVEKLQQLEKTTPPLPNLSSLQLTDIPTRERLFYDRPAYKKKKEEQEKIFQDLLKLDPELNTIYGLINACVNNIETIQENNAGVPFYRTDTAGSEDLQYLNGILYESCLDLVENKKQAEITKKINTYPTLIKLIRQEKYELANSFIASHNFDEIHKCDANDKDACDLILQCLTSNRLGLITWDSIEFYFKDGRNEFLQLVRTLITYHPQMHEKLQTKIAQYSSSLASDIQSELSEILASTISFKESFKLQLFAHIHNDPDLKGSHLEGNSFTSSANYLWYMIDELRSSESIRAKLTSKKEELAKFCELSAQLDKIRQEHILGKHPRRQPQGTINLHALAEQLATQYLSKPQQSISIPGGWCAGQKRSGHAMVYQFKLDPQGQIHLLIFNTGAGLENHVTEETLQHTTYSPVMAITLGTAEKKPDQAQLTALIETLLKPTVDNSYAIMGTDGQPKTEYHNSESIYGQVITKALFLGGEIIAPGKFVDHFILPQFSGTCSWNVLMHAWLGAGLTKDECEEIDYAIRKQSLIEFIVANKIRLKEDNAIIKEQIRFALANFYNLIGKLKNKTAGFKLTEPEFMADCSWLEEIKQGLDSEQTYQLVDGKLQLSAGQSTVLNFSEQFPGSPAVVLQPTIPSSSSSISQNQHLPINFAMATTWQELEDNISKLLTFQASLSQEQSQDFVIEVERCLSNIDLEAIATSLQSKMSKMDIAELNVKTEQYLKLLLEFCGNINQAGKSCTPNYIYSAHMLFGIVNILGKNVGLNMAEFSEILNGVKGYMLHFQSALYFAGYNPIITKNLEYLQKILTVDTNAAQSSSKQKTTIYIGLYNIISRYMKPLQLDSNMQLWSRSARNLSHRPNDELIFLILTSFKDYFTAHPAGYADIKRDEFFLGLQRAVDWKEIAAIYTCKIDDITKHDSIQKAFADIRRKDLPCFLVAQDNNGKTALFYYNANKEIHQYELTADIIAQMGLDSFTFDVKVAPIYDRYKHSSSRYEEKTKELKAAQDKLITCIEEKVTIDYESYYEKICPKATLIAFLQEVRFYLNFQTIEHALAHVGRHRVVANINASNVFSQITLVLTPDYCSRDRNPMVLGILPYNVASSSIEPLYGLWYEKFKNTTLCLALDEWVGYKNKHEGDRIDTNLALIKKPSTRPLDEDVDLIRTFSQIRANTEVQIALSLDFIKQNIHRMTDLDLQLFFQLNIFQPNVLQDQITRNPAIILDIQAMILQGMRFAVQSNEIQYQTFYYFNNLRQLLNNYLSLLPPALAGEITKKQQANDRQMNEFWQRIFTQFEQKRDPDLLVDIHYQNLLHAYNVIKLEPNNDAMQQYIHSSLLVQTFKQGLPTYQAENLAMMHFELRPLMQKFFCVPDKQSWLLDIIKREKLLPLQENSIIKQPMAWPNIEICTRGNDLVYASVNLNTGAISFSQGRQIVMPDNFRQERDFKDFFTIVDLPKIGTMHANGQTIEFDYKGEHYQYTKSQPGAHHWDQSPSIPGTLQKTIRLGTSFQWATLINPTATEYNKPDSLLQTLPKTLFEYGQHVWRLPNPDNSAAFYLVFAGDNVGATQYIFNSITSQINVFENGQITKRQLQCVTAEKLSPIISAISDHGTPSTAKPVPIRIEPWKDYCSLLARFEDPRFIECTHCPDTNETEINLPRYGLVFTIKQQGEQTIACLKNDESMQLDLAIDQLPTLSGFTAFLPMKKINPDGTATKALLLPERFFYAKDLTHVGSHYQLHYDTGNHIEQMTMAEHEHEGPDSAPWLWKFSGSNHYIMINVGSNNALQPNSTHEYLSLIYIYLANHQPIEAWQLLDQLEKSNLAIKNKIEFELLLKIINELPEAVGDPALNTLVTDNSIRAIAVKMKAVHLLEKFKTNISTSTKERLQDLELSERNKQFYAIQEEKFSKNSSPEALLHLIADTHKLYHDHYQYIPADLRLTDQQELKILRSLVGPQKKHPFGHIAVRYYDLVILHLSKEQRELVILQQNLGSKFTEKLKLRLDNINKHLSKVRTITASLNQVDRVDTVIKPPTVDELNALASYIRPKQSQSSAYIFTSQPDLEGVVKPSTLNLLTSEKDLLTSLPIYIMLVQGNPRECPKNWDVKAEQTALAKFLEQYLTAHYNPPTLPEHLELGRREPERPLGVIAATILFHFNRNQLTFNPILTALMSKYLDSKLTLALIDDYAAKQESQLSLKPSNRMHVIFSNASLAGPVIEPIEQPVPSQAPVSTATTEPIKIDDHKLKIPPTIETVVGGFFAEANTSVNPVQTFFAEIKKLLGKLPESPRQQLIQPIRKQDSTPVEQQFIATANRDYAQGRAINTWKKTRNALAKEHLSPEVNAKIKAQLTELLQKINQSEDNAKFLKQKILKQFNTIPTKDPNRSIWLLKRSRLTLEEQQLGFNTILQYYLHGDFNEFKKYTMFTDEEIQAIHVDITNYLLQATQEEQYKNIIAKINDIEQITDQRTAQYVIKLEELGKLLTATRTYTDPYKNRAYLLYEHMQKLLIYSEQLPYLESLLNNASGTYDNTAIQLIMGGGKSKILLPLIATCKANGTNLSIIEVPDALLGSNAADLFKVTQEVFGLTGQIFSFTRSQNTSSADLKKIYKNLRDCINQKQYIITTADAIQALQLKYLELLHYPVEPRLYIVDKFNPKNLPTVDNALVLTNDNEVFFIKDGLLVLNQHKNPASVAIARPPSIAMAETSSCQWIPNTSEPIKSYIQQAIAQSTFDFPNITANHEENKKQLKQLEKILVLFKQQGDALIDEVDAVLDINKEFNYTIGSPENIPLKHREFVVGFYSFLDDLGLADIITGKVKYPDNKYPELAKRIIEALMKDEKSPIQHIIASLSPEHKDKIALFLRGEMLAQEEITKYIGGLAPDDRNRLALYKEQLTKLLPLTLQKQFMVEYGPSRNLALPPLKREIAIPYHCNDCPSEGSEFGNIDLTLTLTVLMQKRTGLSEVVAREMIEQFRKAANNEMIEKNWKIPVTETTVAKHFKALTGGMNLFDLKIDDKIEFQKVYDQLKMNTAVVDYCLVHHVLSNVTNNTKVLKSDRINHVNNFSTVQGMSGTTNRFKTWHERLKFNPAGPGFGTDGQVVDILTQKKPQVTITNNSQVDDIIKLLREKPEFNEFRAIIDCGACFEGVATKKVALQLAASYKDRNCNPPIKYILFYNAQGILSAVNIGSNDIIEINSTVPAIIEHKLDCGLNECFTYYDQAHTVGADIKQMQGAKAFVTVNENTSLRDFLQAVMRMRDLENSHNIEIIVAEKLRNKHPDIAIPWQINTVINVLFDVQLNKMLNEHLMAGLKNMTNIVREKLLLLIMQETDDAKKRQMLQHGQQYFILHDDLDLYTKYCLSEQQVSTAAILEQHSKTLLADYQAYLAHFNLTEPQVTQYPEIEKNLHDITEDYKQYCKTKAGSITRENVEREVVVETEKQQQLKRQVEIDRQQIDEARPLAATTMNPWPDGLDFNTFQIPQIPQNIITSGITLLDLTTIVQPTGFAFDQNIFASNNFYQTYENQTTYMDEYRKEAFAILMVQENNQLTAMLVTPEEASYFSKQLDKQPSPFTNGKTIWLESPGQIKLAGAKPAVMAPEIVAQYDRILEQVHYYNGDCNLLVEQLEKSKLAETKQSSSWLMQNREQLKQKMEYLNDKILPLVPRKKSQQQLLTKTIEEICSVMSTHPEATTTAAKPTLFFSTTTLVQPEAPTPQTPDMGGAKPNGSM